MAAGIQSLPESINRLIIVPDDVLCFLPFEVLLTEKLENGRADFSTEKLEYLFEKYTISYQYSASLMSTLNGSVTDSTESSPFLGIAPSFGEDALSSQRTCSPDMLYSLQCNQDEIMAIQQLVGGQAMLGENANLAGFLASSSQYRILHLATHACVDDTDAAFSKIYFADSSLTQIDLDNLQLKSDLTVLSACNTGTGKLLRGEGVMSLTRGFMLAGSQSVLTSLWSVDDCATSDIMVNFYRGLKKKLSKDEALRQSKLDYLASADQNGRHPYYWAAFVQFGSAAPLPYEHSSLWIYFLSLASVGAALFLVLNKKNA